MTAPIMPPVPEDVLAAQARASDPANSVFVAANAGAGKTHVLASRVIRLLLAGVDPQRILCLTYTRAAAAEMKSRVFATLGEWALMEKSALEKAVRVLDGTKPDRAMIARARQLFARALETPGGLKVETIHAFCERVLQRFPLEAGLSPGFSLIDETEQAELFREALTHVLADPQTGARAEKIALHLDEDGLSYLLSALSGRDPHRRRLLTDQADDMRAARVMHALALEGKEWPSDQIATFLSKGGAHDGVRRAMAVRLADSGKKTLARVADGIAVMLASSRDRDAFDAYSDAWLTGEGKPRVLKTDDPESASFIANEQDAILAILDAEARHAVADFSIDMGVIARAVLKRYDALKSARQLLDFQDLVLHMCALLTGRSEAQWVLYKLDGGLEHILIDEAQDTSPEQWDIVHALAEEFFAGLGREQRDGLERPPRSVFAVGDEKQSIYSFQGADPQGFGESRKKLGARAQGADMPFADVRLIWSFRSSPVILQAVDAVFAQPKASRGLSFTGDNVAHDAIRHDLPGSVELWELTEPPKGEDDEPPWDAPLDALAEDSAPLKLARRIADHIAALCASGIVLASTKKPVAPGDIMILVQRRNAFVDALIRVLKAKDLPVAGADRLKLASHMAVQDLMALGAFVLQPGDDLALAGLLKSPLVGVTEDELFSLAHGRGAKRLRHVIAERAEKGDGNAVAWQARLELFRAEGTRLAPFDFYARVLGPMGGRKAFLARMGSEANDPLDAFLDETARHEEANAPSLQRFLAAFTRGEGEIKRDLDAGSSAIRIMTVHGAKGLEAPIVILPDTMREPVNSRHDPMFHVVDGAVLFKPRGVSCAPLDAAIEAQRAARREESHRALYVAMTRAKEHLVICGPGRTRKMSEGCWYDLTAASLVPGAAEDVSRGYKVWRHVHAPVGAPEMVATPGPAEVSLPLPAWASEMRAGERPHEIIAPSRVLERREGAAATPAADAMAALKRGRIIHKLLEHLPGLSPAARAEAARRYVALPMHGLAKDAQAEMADAALRVFDDPDLAELFAAGLAEAPIAGKIALGGRMMQAGGTIDRLLVTKNRVVILDFKTNRIAPGDAADVGEGYIVQMGLYRELTRALYPSRLVQCVLLYTAAPKAIFLADAAMDRAIAAAFGAL